MMWILLLNFLAFQLIVQTEQCQFPKLPGIINKNYKLLYYKAINIDGTYQFTFPAFTGPAKIKLTNQETAMPSTPTNGQPPLDVDKYKWTGTITSFLPKLTVQEVKAVGYFENLVFFGYIEMVGSFDVWYFEKVPTNQLAKIGFFPTSILYRKWDKEMLAEPIDFDEKMIAEAQNVAANMHTRLFNPGKYCLVQIVCDFFLWNALKAEAGDGAETRLQSYLSEAETEMSEFYGDYKFGAFGPGPQFKFFKPTIIKNNTPETVAKLPFLRPFPIIDIFGAVSNFSSINWNSPCLSILLTYRPHEFHGMGNFGAICRQMTVLEDGSKIYSNTAVINLAMENRLATNSEATFLFKHETGHTLQSLHDKLGSDTLMHPGLLGSREGALSEASKVNITLFLESLDMFAPGDQNGLGNTNCFVPLDHACSRTGTCSAVSGQE